MNQPTITAITANAAQLLQSLDAIIRAAEQLIAEAEQLEHDLVALGPEVEP